MKKTARAFTLVEMAVVLLIAGLLLAGLAMPLAAQVQVRRHEDTRRILEDAREALLAFAAAHGRLPCPAADGARGEEAFAPGGDAANGLCAGFTDGLLPGAALGLAPLDEDGYARDAWSTRANRLRYSVAADTVNGVANPFTRADGLRAATLPAVGDAAHFLMVCATGPRFSPTTCGAASNQVTRRAAFVVVSAGPDTADPADDLLTWSPATLLAARLLAAGRLP